MKVHFLWFAGFLIALGTLVVLFRYLRGRDIDSFYSKFPAIAREIDLHPDVAEYLRQYAVGKSGLLFHTANGTPHLYGNLEDRWLTPRLVKLKLDEEGMGWHAFKRFRKTWLRGARCLEDINNFWMAHKPKTMSEVYSHLHEELETRLAEAERVGYGFTIPKLVAPSAPKTSNERVVANCSVS